MEYEFIGFRHSVITVSGGTARLDADFDPATDRQRVEITDNPSAFPVTDGTESRADDGLRLDAATSAGRQDVSQVATITPFDGSPPETWDFAALRQYTLRSPDGEVVVLYEYGLAVDFNLPGGGGETATIPRGWLATGPIRPGVDYAVLGQSNVSPLTAPGYDILSNALCFCAGTRIATPAGPCRVEDIAPGDAVIARDRGARAVRRVGRRFVGTAAQMADPRERPVLIPAGAFGRGVPARDLRVSRQHRILIVGRQAARRWGRAEVLIAAVRLIGWRGIRRDDRCAPVAYHHLLCDAHEILFAEGAPTESLLPAAVACSGTETAANG